MPYRTRTFRSKAALLILLWAVMSFWSLGNLGYHKVAYFNYYQPIITMAFPISGWLADVYLGRYKVIQYGMRLLWVALIACNTTLILEDYVGKSPALSKLLLVFAGVGAVGSAGIIANALQFGIDQLTDASSSDITSFISWYSWTIFFSETLFLLSQMCYCGVYTTTLSFILLPFLCTLSVLSDCFLNQWLVKEPVTHNPLKLIYQVLRYAVKNKYPRLRSAFTYWEDKPYSRIDLGKAKYGGPFTTEQVEDVKTFFRILAVIGMSAPLMCLITGINFTFTRKLFHQYEGSLFVTACSNASCSVYMVNCYQSVAVRFSDRFFAVLIIPIIEFVIYPLLLKCTCCANATISNKFLIGIFILFVYILQLLCLETVATHISKNPNVTCPFYTKEMMKNGDLLSLNVNWLILPQTLYGISCYVVLSSGAEFITAQAPYSMRGLLFGINFFVFGASYGASHLLTQFAAYKAITMYVTQPGTNCGLWYLGFMLIVTILLLFATLFAVKCYTPRRRDEDLHNEQKFAIEYFEKYLPYNNS